MPAAKKFQPHDYGGIPHPHSLEFRYYIYGRAYSSRYLVDQHFGVVLHKGEDEHECLVFLRKYVGKNIPVGFALLNSDGNKVIQRNEYFT